MFAPEIFLFLCLILMLLLNLFKRIEASTSKHLPENYKNFLPPAKETIFWQVFQRKLSIRGCCNGQYPKNGHIQTPSVKRGSLLSAEHTNPLVHPQHLMEFDDNMARISVFKGRDPRLNKASSESSPNMVP